MKPTLTLLALLFAGVIHLQAQQQPTANEAAWSTLLTAQKAAGATNPIAVAAATPEAAAIKDSIMAGSTITKSEIWIIADVAKATGGEADYKAVFRAIAASGKTGDGPAFARAAAKFWDKDMAGWTSEMLAARPDLAANLAMSLNATPAFKAEAWEALKTRSAHGWSCRNFFKAYRSTLPKAAQIEATQKQKDLVLAIPTRDAAANAWLAEISADLVALQLDQ